VATQFTSETPTGARTSPRRALVSLAVDVVAVLLFVVIGRRSHDEGGNPIAGALSVAAPFLIALGVGWLASRAWRSPTSMLTGTIIWACTVVAGLLLRRFAFDRSTAFSFMIVTTITLGVFLLGWRAVAARFSTTPEQ